MRLLRLLRLWFLGLRLWFLGLRLCFLGLRLWFLGLRLRFLPLLRLRAWLVCRNFSLVTYLLFDSPAVFKIRFRIQPQTVSFPTTRAYSASVFDEVF